MTIEEIKATLEERQEMQRIIDEAQTVLDACTDKIKAHMEETGIDELTAGPYKATWKYSKPRVVADEAKMKAAGIFDAFCKTSKPARPFRVI